LHPSGNEGESLPPIPNTPFFFLYFVFFEIETDFNPLHPQKASLPMEVTESGMVTEVNPLHPPKARSPMDVTESGMVTEVNALHRQKMELNPIFSTESGIVTEVNPLHPEKAS